MDRPVFVSVQCLRGVAALLVVLFHLRIVEARFGAGEPLLPSFVRFADAGVDLFFVISGFVMVTVASGRYGSPAQAGRFLARRTWRIVPPYWFYTTLVVVLMLVAPDAVNSSYADQGIVASYLLWPQAQLPLLTVGWTLIHEMYFYLAMAVAIAFLRERHLPVFLLCWATLVTIGQVALADGAHPVTALLLNAMTLEFIGGALVAVYWRRLGTRMSVAWVALGAMGFATGLFVLDQAGTQAPGPVLRTLLFGTAGVLVVAGAATLERLDRWQAPRWLATVGEASYSLYLSHVFVISAAGRLWHWSGLNTTGTQHALFVLATLLACIVAGQVSYRWLELPLLARRSAAPRRDAVARAY